MLGRRCEDLKAAVGNGNGCRGGNTSKPCTGSAMSDGLITTIDSDNDGHLQACTQSILDMNKGVEVETREAVEHKQYGHLDVYMLAMSRRLGLVKDVDVHVPNAERLRVGRRKCEHCPNGKQTMMETAARANEKMKSNKPRFLFSWWQSDIKIWSKKSWDGFHMMLMHIDCYGGEAFLHKLDKKSSWLTIGCMILAMSKNVLAEQRAMGQHHLYIPPKYHTDAAKEIMCKEAQSLFDTIGTNHTISPAFHKMYNKNVERAWRTRSGDQKTWLADSQLPPSFYMELYESSNNLRQLIPCRSNPGMKSPFQMRTKKVPSLKWVKRVGALVLALVDPDKRGSNDPKVLPGWMLGLNRQGNGWRVWHDVSLPRIDIRVVYSGTVCQHITYAARQRFDIAGYWCNRVPRCVDIDQVSLVQERDKHLIAWFDEEVCTRENGAPAIPSKDAAIAEFRLQRDRIREAAQRTAEVEDTEDEARGLGCEEHGDAEPRVTSAARPVDERLQRAMEPAGGTYSAHAFVPGGSAAPESSMASVCPDWESRLACAERKVHVDGAHADRNGGAAYTLSRERLARAMTPVVTTTASEQEASCQRLDSTSEVGQRVPKIETEPILNRVGLDVKDSISSKGDTKSVSWVDQDALTKGPGIMPCLSVASDSSMALKPEGRDAQVWMRKSDATPVKLRPRRELGKPTAYVAEPAKRGKRQGDFAAEQSSRFDAMDAALDTMQNEVHFRVWQRTLQQEAAEVQMQGNAASGPQLLTTKQLGDTMVTGLEGNVWGTDGENLVDRFGMPAMQALVAELWPDDKDDDGDGIPLQHRIGANAANGVPMSEPTMRSHASTLPLTMEERAVVSEYKVPRRRSEMLQMPEAQQRLYHAAEAKEVHAQEHVYKLMRRVPRRQVPRGQMILRPTFAYKIKGESEALEHGGLRARGCVIGTRMRELLTAWEMFSPTASIDSLRMVCAFAPTLQLDLHKLDASFAFANSRRPSPFYMEMYKGHEDPLKMLLDDGTMDMSRYAGQSMPKTDPFDPAEAHLYDAAQAADIEDPVLQVFGNLQGTPEAAKIWNETFAEEYAGKQGARRFSESDCEVWIIFRQGEGQCDCGKGVECIESSKCPNWKEGSGEMVLAALHVDDVIAADSPGTGAAIAVFCGRDALTGKHAGIADAAYRRKAKQELAHMPKPETSTFTGDAVDGPVCSRLPFGVEKLDVALGLNIERRGPAVVLSLKNYVAKTAQQLFGKHPTQVPSPKSPMEKGEYLTTAECPRSMEDEQTIARKVAELPFDFDFQVWLGKLGYAAHMLMFPVAVAASNCGRVAGKGGSVPGINMLVRSCKWAFGSQGFGFEVVYSRQDREHIWYTNRLMLSADAAAPVHKLTDALVKLDPKLASARIGFTAVMNGGVIGYGTHLTRKPVAGAPSGETHAVHYASRKVRIYLKFLSYLAVHGAYVPHFEHLAPVLIQQDCKATQFLVHTPKPRMDGQAELLQLANMQQDARDGIMDTQDTRSADMGADILTKGLVGKNFVNGVAMNAHGRLWRPIDTERHMYRARKCRKPGCYSMWLVHEHDEQFDCMAGVCQRCGTRTLS